jgi:hypothetical protein
VDLASSLTRRAPQKSFCSATLNPVPVIATVKGGRKPSFVHVFPLRHSVRRNGRVFARHHGTPPIDNQWEALVDVLDGTSAVQNLWNALPGAVQKRLQDTKPPFRRAFHSDPDDESYAQSLDGFAPGGNTGLVYDEHAFDYILEIERRRAESTQQPFLLMLLECSAPEGPASAAVTPDRLFPILRKCLRETDVVGWYLQGVVVGAALTPDCRTGAQHASSVVRDRMNTALRDNLPPDAMSGLRLHLYEVVGEDERRVE